MVNRSAISRYLALRSGSTAFGMYLIGSNTCDMNLLLPWIWGKNKKIVDIFIFLGENLSQKVANMQYLSIFGAWICRISVFDKFSQGRKTVFQDNI